MTKRKTPNLDSVTSVNADGSHYILHPSDVSGRFTWKRRVFAILLLAVYLALPWIKINGAPAVCLDIIKREFHFFGITLAPQDLWVLFFGITGLGFGLFFITALFGRLWCGWACPYTIFLEHIFRRIERLIEGDAPKRKKLDQTSWTFTKIWKRVLKHTIYVFLAATLAHVFLSYFISLEKVYQYIQENPIKHIPSFILVVFLTTSFYFCFAHFREQFCIMVCPYGRLQSAMTDDDTLIIGYDEHRGEPRGKANDPTKGDCIDCRRCVNVCPTGIDIRNGLQLECIGCAACIDACDQIMEKLDRRTGLVRYDSLNGLEGKPLRFLRPRILLYSFLGSFGLLALALTALKKATPYTINSSRMKGPPFYVDETTIRNHYQLRLLNKRNQTATFQIFLSEPPEGFSLSEAGQEITVKAHGEVTRPTIIIAPYHSYKGPTQVVLKVKGEPGGVVFEHTVRFVGPNPASLKKKH